MKFIKNILPFTLIIFVILSSGCFAQQKIQPKTQHWKFDFGTAKVASGYTAVNASTFYSDETGYGFEKVSSINMVNCGGANTLTDGFVTADKPFYFSVKVLEGNYNVKVILGDKEVISETAIRAECRRMMVNRLQTKKGETKTVEFTLHIRDSLIRNAAGVYSKVRLKPRERAYFHWDNKLTLEFNGASPKVDAIEITPAASDVVTRFLADNSTEVDQAEEPYSAWGQMIPSFFVPQKVTFANYVESGEALSSFIGEKRFEKELSLMKAGDYAFV